MVYETIMNVIQFYLLVVTVLLISISAEGLDSSNNDVIDDDFFENSDDITTKFKMAEINMHDEICEYSVKRHKDQPSGIVQCNTTTFTELQTWLHPNLFDLTGGYLKRKDIQDLNDEINLGEIKCSYYCMYNYTHTIIIADRPKDQPKGSGKFNLTGFDPSILDLFGYLEFIDLSGNFFSTVESGVYSKSASLQKIDFSNNEIKHFSDDALLGLKLLNTLDISHNLLTAIPNGLGYLENLFFLDLSFNRVSDLFDIGDADGDTDATKSSLNKYEPNYKVLKMLNLAENQIELVTPAFSEAVGLKSQTHGANNGLVNSEFFHSNRLLCCPSPSYETIIAWENSNKNTNRNNLINNNTNDTNIINNTFNDNNLTDNTNTMTVSDYSSFSCWVDNVRYNSKEKVDARCSALKDACHDTLYHSYNEYKGSCINNKAECETRTTTSVVLDSPVVTVKTKNVYYDNGGSYECLSMEQFCRLSGQALNSVGECADSKSSGNGDVQDNNTIQIVFIVVFTVALVVILVCVIYGVYFCHKRKKRLKQKRYVDNLRNGESQTGQELLNGLTPLEFVSIEQKIHLQTDDEYQKSKKLSLIKTKRDSAGSASSCGVSSGHEYDQYTICSNRSSTRSSSTRISPADYEHHDYSTADNTIDEEYDQPNPSSRNNIIPCSNTINELVFVPPPQSLPPPPPCYLLPSRPSSASISASSTSSTSELASSPACLLSVSHTTNPARNEYCLPQKAYIGDQQL